MAKTTSWRTSLPAQHYRKTMRRYLLTLAFIWVTVLPVTAQNYPDHSSVYLNDFAGLIDAETGARILSMLEQAKAKRDHEVVVVTINQMTDYEAGHMSIEDFGTGLFNHWGVGNAQFNDGILILVSRYDRKMRIALGSGYPMIYDGRMKRVIDDYFLPDFKNDDYAEGIELGVRETLRRSILSRDDSGNVIAPSRLADLAERARDTATSGGLISWLLGIFGIGGAGISGGISWRRFRRNRPRECDLCGRKMWRLSEQNDDAYLSHGQQVEEAITSKDYDVWFCDRCDHAMIEGYKKWFSEFSACPSCHFKTLHSQRTVLSQATTSSTGKARVDYACRNCVHRSTETVTIAKKSSSSLGSSGSFGGGSSSGGGASGSW